MDATSEEARQLQAQDLQFRAMTVGGAAAAIIHVREDGALTVACSCGESIYHPSGQPGYTLNRLQAHLLLHATAAKHGVPWDVVQAEQDRRLNRGTR